VRTNAVRRALDIELAAARRRRGGGPPAVLDVGGGSGMWAVPLAVAGCSVTVVDPSPDALAVLRRRAEDAACSDRVTAVQGDTDVLADLVPAASADVVLAHGVLEVVDDLPASVRALARATAAGGVLSVLVANRFGAVLAWAAAGHVDEARRLLNSADGRLPHEVVQRRLDTEQLTSLLLGAGLSVELVQGDGVVTDLVPGSAPDATPDGAEALTELERIAAVTPPLRDVATRLHALARRPPALG
jgi:SAM-dependent methyltransferase